MPKCHFSIIISTSEKRGQLVACLDSLSALDYPHDLFEVIVVDYGGKIPLKPVVLPFGDDFKLILLTETNTDSVGARNTGATQASGAFLVFTNDDCKPTPNWLKKMPVRLAQTPDEMIAGRVLNGSPRNVLSAALHLMRDAASVYFSENRCPPHVFASDNMVVPAEQFRALGGFDTTLRLGRA